MYKIGEFSLLSKMTVKALRFYEEQGLIKPCFVDEFTSYRYYSADQLAQVEFIVKLREIGLSVKDIKRVFSGEDLNLILEERKKSIDEQIGLCNSQLLKIKLMQKEQAMKEQIFIKEIPEYTVYYKDGKIANFGEIPAFVLWAGTECAKANPNLKCVEPNYCYLSYLDGEYREENIAIRYVEAVESVGVETENIKFTTIPKTKCVCIQHKGAYADMRSSYNEIIKYIEDNGLKIDGFPRECYIDGCWNKQNEDDYLTEIQFPVK
ncbi:MAG: GyrI-like domain-containing protein [Candidatus Coproplasma sp.]